MIKGGAKKFEFVPGEIRVAHGEKVVLHLSAPEVPMGFSLPDFGMRADVVPGKVTLLEHRCLKRRCFVRGMDPGSSPG